MDTYQVSSSDNITTFVSQTIRTILVNERFNRSRRRFISGLLSLDILLYWHQNTYCCMAARGAADVAAAVVLLFQIKITIVFPSFFIKHSADLFLSRHAFKSTNFYGCKQDLK